MIPWYTMHKCNVMPDILSCFARTLCHRCMYIWHVNDWLTVLSGCERNMLFNFHRWKNVIRLEMHTQMQFQMLFETGFPAMWNDFKLEGTETEIYSITMYLNIAWIEIIIAYEFNIIKSHFQWKRHSIAIIIIII